MTKSKDMTPAQASIAFDTLQRVIGPEAGIYVSLQMPNRWDRLAKPALSASVYPRGISQSMAFACQAEAFAELLEAVAAKWVEHSEEHTRRTVRRMALEIIRITADLGQCNDAALREAKFTQAELDTLAVLACADANEIAANGPFTVVAFGGANGAPADAEEAA